MPTGMYERKPRSRDKFGITSNEYRINALFQLGYAMHRIPAMSHHNARVNLRRIGVDLGQRITPVNLLSKHKIPEQKKESKTPYQARPDRKIKKHVKYNANTGKFSSNNYKITETERCTKRRRFMQITIKSEQFYSHRLAMQLMGVEIGGLVVHHRDNDPTNNKFSNLEVMTNAEHTQYHALQRSRN